MENNLKDIIAHCELRWGTDDNLLDFENKVLNWVNQAEEKEKVILLTLLKSFEYYTIQRVNKVFGELHAIFSEMNRDILHTYQNNAYLNTLFIPVYKKDGTRTSSFDMHGCYRYTNQLSKHCFKTELSVVLEDETFPFEQIDNIVFIDDMIGTGSTMVKFVKSMMEQYGERYGLQSKRFFLIVLEACSHGVDIIEKYKEESGINLTLIYSKLHKKAFSEDHIFFAEELEVSRRIIYELELRINNNNTRNVLGYEGSEALMSFYHNIPNNTLSSFWQENESIGWQPLFPRARHDNPFSKRKKLSEKHDLQKKSNYIAKSL
ncbi:hypothetical protein QUF95_21065 [Paenibacillus silvae]|uniref:phosphoribosyltransferase-like protein n=1 Tax=Paenibacillus silvae TaxID=1325358 RepID=UPI0025A2E1AB|nr:hypothetical protein [Paenibacillus silvae]MDM5279899.1 hypothetical protein [Paenibacillus silvae]